MTTILKQYRPRGREILEILKSHGPLSATVIRKMTQPMISGKGFTKAMSILRREGFVEHRSNDQGQYFYQIEQSKKQRRAIAEILCCQAEDLLQPLIFRSEWLHHQSCEYWIYLLKRIFSDARIIREAEFPTSEEAKRVLLISDQDFDVAPDFILVIPSEKSARATYVAFEVERTRKSEKRLIQKLSKYANRSTIDGLIYVCETDRLSEALRLTYEKNICSKSHRIKHYGENFFLFSDAIEPSIFPFSRLFNAQRKAISIVHWCNYLCSTKHTLRRNVTLG